MSVVLNAADEAAVELFLNEKCSFTDITECVTQAMEHHLCSMRSGGAEKNGPFSLSCDMLSMQGAELEEACWEKVRAIEELCKKTAAFVHNHTACGGQIRC